MLISPAILPQLSPTASKIYLALLSFLQPNASPDSQYVSASIADLSARSAISPRTCKDAIHELMNLQLLRRLPRQYHQPSTYQLLPPPAPLKPTDCNPWAPTSAETNMQSPAPSPQTKVQPPLPSLPTNVQPPAPYYAPKVNPSAPSHHLTPLPTPKTPRVQFPSPSLTQILAMLFDPTDSATHDQIAAVFHLLSPAEKSIAITLAKTCAASPVPQEARP